jgi:hypothetical protein
MFCFLFLVLSCAFLTIFETFQHERASFSLLSRDLDGHHQHLCLIGGHLMKVPWLKIDNGNPPPLIVDPTPSVPADLQCDIGRPIAIWRQELAKRVEQRRGNILWERDRGLDWMVVRDCEACWQYLSEGQLSLLKQGDWSKVADTTNSISLKDH